MGMLALCAGIWIDRMSRNVMERKKRHAMLFGAMAVVTGSVSVALGRANPPPPIHWDHIVWGYIKMGRVDEARMLAERIASEQPRNGPILEALGFTAIARAQYSEAAQYYQRAIEIRPQSHIAHYNLAKVFLQLGD